MKNVINRYVLLIFVLCVFNTMLKAQEFTAEEGLTVKEQFRTGNYGIALKEFKKLSEEDPKNMEYKYIIAQCILFINNEKAAAIPLLQEVWKNDNLDPEVLFDLGCAFHYNMKFNEAIDSFTQAIEVGTDGNKRNAEAWIEYVSDRRGS